MVFPVAQISAAPDFDSELCEHFEFLRYASSLSGVERGTRIADGSRRENVAEHSWHLALAALLLIEFAPSEVSLFRVLKMLLIHDLVEIEACDTPLFSSEPAHVQLEREQRAADTVFGRLPDRISAELHELWHEFETAKTWDSRFAKALDRLQPLLMNHSAGGGTWVDYNVHRDQEDFVVHAIERGSPILAEAARRLLDDAVARGILRPRQASRLFMNMRNAY